jgi:hypothetical protein
MTTITLAARIAAASKDVGGKLKADKTNTQQSYDYISADKMLAVCGQALADQGIALLPAVTHVEVNRLENQSGKARYDASVNFVFTLTDGVTQFELPFAGCGSDYTVPDKAVYKAITSGHKYFLAKMLNIGVGNEDGEHEMEEVKPPPSQRPQRPQKPEESFVQEEEVDRYANDPEVAAKRKKANTIGASLWGQKWDDVRHANIGKLTENRTQSIKGLTLPELDRFVDGLQKKQDELQAAARRQELAEATA